MPTLEAVRRLPENLQQLMSPFWTHMDIYDQEAGGRVLEGVELFSGAAQMSWAMINRNIPWMWFDQVHEEDWGREDMTTLQGFHMAMLRVLQIKPGGLCWAALECKTHVWIGRSTTGRSSDFPAGDITQSRIAKANCCVGYTTLLLLLCWLRDVQFIIEQPMNSILVTIEPLRSFILFIQGHLQPVSHTYFAAFGAETAKPISFWGNWWGATHLRRRCPSLQLNGEPLKQLAEKGQRWTNGKTKQLTQSAAYPALFSTLVAELVQQGPPRDVLSWLGASSSNTKMASWQEIEMLLDTFLPPVNDLGIFSMASHIPS